MEKVTTQTQYRLAGIIFLAQSLFSASFITAFVLTPILAVSLSGSDSQAGVPNTVVLVARALVAYPFGLLMDRMGRRVALATGYLGFVAGGVIAIVAIVTQSYLLFLLASFMIGVSRTAGDQSRFIVAEIFPLNRRATVIGAIVFAGTVGSVLGPNLVSVSRGWVQAIGLPADSGPFLVAAVMMAVASIITFIFLRPDPREIGEQIADEEREENPDSIESKGEARSWQEIFSQPMVQLSVLSMTLGYFVMTLVMVITAVHMKSGLNLPFNEDEMASAVARVIMFHTLGMFGISIFSGFLIDKVGRLNMILAGAVVLALSTVVSAFATNVVLLALGLFLLGLGWNFAFVAGSSLLSNSLAQSERGQMQGIAETFVSVAAGTASLSVGWLFAMGGYNLINTIGFIFSAILLLAVIYLPRQAKKQQRQASKLAQQS
ncbi:MAG: MFS transporter [Anaerolineae bacterium]